ncbi:GFA family protein [Sphingomonas astaxanthinifaciens]|uniref:Aldehyde-activating protein n=1 Tax=Sphingomonas astaxanthinifaciens DSM 22298 TaxID=1123267 RepID=A0ABQ5Z2Q4_9SPHN|nr:GFA family protein [Sphingomonas astaxanthinifaciens]GLR47054.1 aldehyde-activating protein [Sphingomonas astaxanthinifaciens DSM 22298]
MTQMTGGCACGAKRFSVDLPDDHHAYLCHCRMCQRASGNVSLAMVGVRQDAVTWTQEPDWYRSSAIAERPFCAQCGTTLGFRYAEGTDKMDLTVAAFDDPSGFVPKSHFGVESMHRAWVNTEGLPEMRSEDYAALQERWAKAKAD